MAASFRGFPANPSPFIIKFFKRLLNRRRGHPARGRVASFYGLSRLTAYLTLGLFFCSLLAAPQALAGQTITINGNASDDVLGNGPGYNGYWDHNSATLLNPSNNFVFVKSGSMGMSVFGGFAPGNAGTATATDNMVSINGTVGRNVYGGYALSFAAGRVAALLNEVAINGGTVREDVSGGYALSQYGSFGTAAAEGNTVTISGGTVDRFVHGGLAVSDSSDKIETAAAKDNVVDIVRSTVGLNIYGGEAFCNNGGTVTALFNEVTINDSTVGGSVIGGRAQSGNGTAMAIGNTIGFISGKVSGPVYGGLAHDLYGGNALATGNTIDISGATNFGTNAIYGGSAESSGGTATATDNEVTINDSPVGGNVYGGSAESSGGTATTTDNAVAISGGMAGGAVYGGYARGGGTATASDNRVNISGGTVGEFVFGGFAASAGAATARDNLVNITSASSLGSSVFGGSAASSFGGIASARFNEVTINGGMVGWNVYGGSAENSGGTATASNNKATISVGGRVDQGVYGGYARSGGSATAADNVADISGSSVGGDVLGGYAQALSGKGKATAEGNKATISAGGTVENVWGGFAQSDSETAEATGNRADLGGGSRAGGFVYGGHAHSTGTAEATGNRIDISGGSRVGKNVFGGSAYGTETATAKDNSVDITGESSLDWSVFGGHARSDSGTATATENSVAIRDKSTVGGDVTGGKATDGYVSATASGNAATISGGGTVGGSVLGGEAVWSAKSSATSNTVTIIGGTVDWNESRSLYYGVYGGFTFGAETDAADNSVSIRDKSSVRGGSVYGGFAHSVSGTATATGNSVAISDSTVDGTTVVELDEDEGGDGLVIGTFGFGPPQEEEDRPNEDEGGGDEGPVTGSFGFGLPQEVVIVTGGDVFGGYAVSDAAGTATATGNSVAISDQSTVRGGDVIGGFAASNYGTATAAGNSVTISDSTVDRVIADWIYGGSVYGGKADQSGQSSASGNTVTINGSAVDLAVFGGFAQGRETAGAEGNRVDLNGGSRVGAEVYGGFAYGGQASATGNTVAISGGGLVRGDVFGGLASSGNESATACGNKVEMSGGTLDWANLYGGYAYSFSGTATASENSLSISGDSILRGDVFGGFANSFNGTARATGNTINISGDPDFGTGSSIYGGLAYSYGGAYFGDSFTGNILNKNSPVNIQSVKNFEYINFGYGGLAGIANLDTTPTGSARPGVVLKTSTAPLDFNGVIYGSGALAKTGAGTLTLSGANTYTGLTEVREGTLALAGAGRIGSALALYNQTTFDSGGKYLTLNSLEVKNQTGGSANLKAPEVVIGPQGTVEVGLNTLNIGGNLYFTGGGDSYASTYKLAGNSQNTGLISVAGKAHIYEGAKLAYTGSFANLTGNTILTAASFNDGTYFKNPLLEFQFRDYTDHTDLVVTGQRNIGDVTTSISPGGNSSHAGAVIQAMPYSELKNRLLLNVQDFALADDQAQADKALRQFIGEGSLNAVNAHYDTVSQMASVLDGRIQTLTEGQTAPAAGSGPAENRLWLKPFGQWNRQDDENGALGYRYHSGGLMLGYDREMAGLTLGLYGSLAKGFLENDLAETDIQTTGLGLYGLYEFGGGYFADLNFGYGHSDNESNIDLVFGGRKTSKFSTDSFQTGLNFGRVFQLNQDTTLTPSAGLRYTHVKQNGWQEKIVSDPDNKVVANWFGDSRQNFVEIPLNLKLAATFETVGGAAVTPELRFGGIIAANHPKSELRMGFVGSDESTTISGLAPGRGRLTTGAGVKSQLSETLDISVNYDLEFRKGYQGHSAYAVLGVSF